ncbi:MAG: hypothetical protein J6D19_03225 [Clostridia bacterium]|nr:hypothetical protein [Clostridia bacterium]
MGLYGSGITGTAVVVSGEVVVSVVVEFSVVVSLGVLSVVSFGFCSHDAIKTSIAHASKNANIFFMRSTPFD